MENLKVYKIGFTGRDGIPDAVYMTAHSEEYARQCFEECSKDKIIYIDEMYVGDGLIFD